MNELINQQREQIAQLMAERDALAAQLVMIRKIFRDESLSTSETLRKIPFVIDLTPNQCLAELRAEAVTKFAKYIDDIGELNFGDSNFVLAEASQYAEQIRKGGAE